MTIDTTEIDRARARIRAAQLANSTTFWARLIRWWESRKQSVLAVRDDPEFDKADDTDTGFSRMMAGAVMTGPIRIQRDAAQTEAPVLRPPSAWAILVYFPYLLPDIFAIANEQSKARRQPADERRARSLRRHEERRLRALSRSMYGRYGR